MAIGTLSACLPTYRPILHRVFKRKTFHDTNRTKTSRRLPTATNSSSLPTDHDASSIHPFNRLEEDPYVVGDWTSTIPLADMTHHTTTSDQPRGSNVVTQSCPNGIKIITEIEQRSD